MVCATCASCLHTATYLPAPLTTTCRTTATTTLYACAHCRHRTAPAPAHTLALACPRFFTCFTHRTHSFSALTTHYTSLSHHTHHATTHYLPTPLCRDNITPHAVHAGYFGNHTRACAVPTQEFSYRHRLRAGGGQLDRAGIQLNSVAGSDDGSITGRK